MEKHKKIFIAGGTGMVGSALVRKLKEKGFENILAPGRKELDLMDRIAVREYFEKEKPSYVILAAAKVGGIKANSDFPADFIYENLEIQNNVIKEALDGKVEKFCFIGSSCVYPVHCPQPMKEEYLLTGPLEPTNEGYSLAKIAGLKMVQFFRKQYNFPGISVMPCNLYGKNDCFDLNNSHVLSALVRRFVDALDNGLDEVEVWGSGKAIREFMNVDDAADGILFMMENYSGEEIVNLGTGSDVTIKELAETIKKLVAFNGEIKWDRTKPDGMMRKCLDITRMKELGFEAKISLEEGIKELINDYRQIKKENK